MTKARIQGINNHQKLVRASMLTIGIIKGAVSRLDGQEAVGLTRALEMLTDALYGQKVRDEQVTITVRGGVAECTNKTDFVEVTIINLDNEG